MTEAVLVLDKRPTEFCQRFDTIKESLYRYSSDDKVQDTLLQLVTQLICFGHGKSYGRFNIGVNNSCVIGYALNCGCYHETPLTTLEQIRAQPYGRIDHDPSHGRYSLIAWQHEAMKWSEVLYYFDLLEWQIQRAERITNSTIISKTTPG